MNREYKKGFLEAIDGVLDILNTTNIDYKKDNITYNLLLKNIENEVLGLKIAFFETYYEDCEEEVEKKDENTTQEDILKSIEEDDERIKSQRKFRMIKVYAIVLYEEGNEKKHLYHVHKLFKTKNLQIAYMLKYNFNNDQLMEFDVLESPKEE